MNESLYPFKVYIVESPSPANIQQKQIEGPLLGQALHLAGVSYRLHRAKTIAGLKRILKSSIPEDLRKHHEDGHFVIIHISCHGDVHGIELTDGSSLNWDELYPWLADINYETKGSLVLCMSSCHGAFSSLAAMENVELPFRAVVGSDFEPTWSETAVGFACFYHLLQRGKTLPEAVAIMKDASDHENFIHQYGQAAKDLYETMRDDLLRPDQEPGDGS